MVKRMSVQLLVSGISLLLQSGCGDKEKGVVAVPIGFLADVTLTPTRPVMRRGDTLWLTGNFSDSLQDMHSGKRYRVRPQDLQFRSALVFKSLQGIGKEPLGIAQTFTVVPQLGQATIGGTLTAPFEPVYDGSRYRFRIGLLPSQVGVTAISLLLAPAEGNRGLGKHLRFLQLPQDAQGREQRPVLDDSFYSINQGSANNFALYQQHTKAFSFEPGNHPGQDMYEQHSTFTVEVR